MDRTNDSRTRNRRRRRRHALIRGIFRCAFMVFGLCLTVALLTKLLNGELRCPEEVEERISGKNVNLSVSAKEETRDVELSQQELEELPDSIQQLYEKNEEAREFVANYNKEHNLDEEIDISKEVTQGQSPLFLQWDERWGYRQYGADCMGITGCGPTALSMVYCGLTGDTSYNPYAIAQKAYGEGYYVEGSGSSWDMMSNLANDLGLYSTELSRDESVIIGELRNGHPVICIMGPGDFTDQGHFIVLSGIDEDGMVIVKDPNSKKNSKKHWNLSKIISQMKNLWSYQL